MSEERIPEEVWEGRCRWCAHRKLEENKTFEKEMVYREWYNQENVPCRISTVARYDRMPGECLSFAPNYIFGICKTCEYNNSFHEGYCTRDGQPNKRQVYIGQSAYSHKPDYWQKHELSTCDGYEPHHGWIAIMRRQAAEGKIPRNFDPETMKMLDPHEENQMAEKWEEVDRMMAEEAKRKKAEMDRAKVKAAAEAEKQIPGQLSLADLL